MKRMVSGLMLALVLASTLALTLELQSIKAGLTPRVFLYPESQTVGDVGDSFTIDVGIADVSDLYGYSLYLYYNSTLMNGTQVTEGSFLRSAGVQTQFWILNFTDSYNATDGFLLIVGSLMGDVPGVSGGGVLVTVEFKSLALGNSVPVHLVDVELADSVPSLIPHEDSDGTVTVGSTLYQASPPVASFDWSPHLRIVNGEVVTFNGSSSFAGWNGSQTVPIVSYTWDFGDKNTAAGQVVIHSYSSPGNYEVSLNVTDNEGLWDAAQRQIEVGQPQVLIAEFTESSETAVGEALEFDASSSIESWNGTYAAPITEYLWDFGDGNVTSTNSATIAHTYASQGTFNVTLTISDANGEHSSCSKTVMLAAMNIRVFSVESNSTISGLAFDATNWTLSFAASGPSGTKGYAKVTVAKSLVPNLADILVYVDNNVTEYSTNSQDGSYLLTFNYTHSTHQILLRLSIIPIPEFTPFMVLPFLMLLTVLVGVKLRRRALVSTRAHTELL